MKNKINKFFSSQFTLTAFMIVIVFLFTYVPNKVKGASVIVVGFFLLYLAYKLYKKRNTKLAAMVCIEMAISLFASGSIYLLKISEFKYYSYFEPYLMIFTSLLFILVFITIYAAIKKTEDQRKIKVVRWATLFVVMPIILFIFMWVTEIIK
jgi:uncharacterized membrane protein YfcA